MDAGDAVSDTITHDLAAGVVVVRDESVLAVRQCGRWSFPKGGVEPGESIPDAAVREAREETGLDVTLHGVAFVTEFTMHSGGYALQTYFEATAEGVPDEDHADPDGEIESIAFVPLDEVATYLPFRPYVLPFREWLDGGRPCYRSFDLTVEPAELTE
jgi:8-oxo-dGTP pyrophosphatase MutT (NUDIX family)